MRNETLHPIRGSQCLSALLFAITTTTAVAAPSTPTIVDNGTSTYSIVVDPSASPAVRRAANELSQYIDQISGAAIPIVTSTPAGPAIFVGQGAAEAKAFPHRHLDGLPAESFEISPRGHNLLIAGPDDRGTIYGTYSFLEDDLGVGWYAPDATVVWSAATIRSEER